MIQIKKRYTDAILFEYKPTQEEQSSGIAMRAALGKAVESRANLADANLAGAYLAGAKWRDGITINRAPLQLSGLRWMVYILDSHMQIGCELHSLADWATFDDNRIIQMDGKDALRFWRAHKDALLSLAKSDGRE